MRMSWQQLKNLPVVTRSGQALGHVDGFIFDPELHAIVQYEVRQGMPLARRTLLVAASQVLGITAEHMTVDDAVGRGETTEQAQQVPATETPASGLATSRKVS